MESLSRYQAEIEKNEDEDEDEDENEKYRNKNLVAINPESTPWFSAAKFDVLIYKVNQRPIGNTGPSSRGVDTFAHLFYGLHQFSGAIISKIDPSRFWRVGNLYENHEVIYGVIGWARDELPTDAIWDNQNRYWIGDATFQSDSATAPFVYMRENELFGVLHHPSFPEIELTEVLAELASNLTTPTPVPEVSIGINPMGDPEDLFSWVEGVDKLNVVKLTFTRPNPHGKAAFEELFARLKRLELEHIEETLTAQNLDVGVNKEALQEDPITNGFIEGAMSSYGSVVINADLHGNTIVYDQKERVLREPVQEAASSLEQAQGQILVAIDKAIGKWKNRLEIMRNRLPAEDRG